MGPVQHFKSAQLSFHADTTCVWVCGAKLLAIGQLQSNCLDTKLISFIKIIILHVGLANGAGLCLDSVCGGGGARHWPSGNLRLAAGHWLQAGGYWIHWVHWILNTGPGSRASLHLRATTRTRGPTRGHTLASAPPPHFTAQVSCRLVLLGAFSRRLAPPITQLIKSRAGATIERNGNIKLFILGAPTALGSARHARQKQRARSFIKPKWGPEHWVASDRARKLSIWRIRCARSCNNIHLCIRGPHSWAPHFALH